jgi:hypothetical protein
MRGFKLDGPNFHVHENIQPLQVRLFTTADGLTKDCLVLYVGCVL